MFLNRYTLKTWPEKVAICLLSVCFLQIFLALLPIASPALAIQKSDSIEKVKKAATKATQETEEAGEATQEKAKEAAEKMAQETKEASEAAKEKAGEMLTEGKEKIQEKMEAILSDEESMNAMTKAMALLGFGGVTGFVMGYTLKKMLKIVIVVLGLFLFGIQGLAYAGWVTIHWVKIKEATWPFIENNTFKDQLMAFMTAQFPYVGGFAGGFYLGLKKG